MATYRPKKLDEINSVFGESVKAQEAIKSGTIISEEVSVRPEESAEKTTAESGFKATPGQSAAQDITAIADEFIMRFGTPERAAATARLRENEAIKAKVVPAGTAIKAKIALSEQKTAEKAVKQDKESAEVLEASPLLNKISAEKDQLMEDYMRVMNDDDEDTSPFIKRIKDKKGRKKKSREKDREEAPAPQEPAEEVSDSTPELLSESEDEIPVVKFEVPEELLVYEEPKQEADQEPQHIVEQEPEAEAEVIQQSAVDLYDIAEQELLQEYEDTDEGYDVEVHDDYEDIMSRYDDDDSENQQDGDFQPEGKKRNSKGRAAVRVLLSVMLIIVMLCACVVGAARLTLGVNTGSLVAEKYRIFTSEAEFPFVGVSRGDLIVTEDRYPVEGESFVYTDNENKIFAFAKLDSTAQDEKTGKVICLAETDGRMNTVYRDNTRGVIAKVIPGIGEIVSALNEYYILVIVLLLGIAIVLLLTVVFALSPKRIHDKEIYSEEIPDTDEYEDIYSESDSDKITDLQ